MKVNVMLMDFNFFRFLNIVSSELYNFVVVRASGGLINIGIKCLSLTETGFALQSHWSKPRKTQSNGMCLDDSEP